MSKPWTTCTDCGRVLNLEDGPTCPECRAKRRAEAKDRKARVAAKQAAAKEEAKGEERSESE